MSDKILTELAWKAVHNEPGEIAVSKWGGSEDVNCYAFAANCKNPGRAKPDPGDAKKKSPKDETGKFTATGLVDGAKADGMTDVGSNQVAPPSPQEGRYLVALYISSDRLDHHWYRKDPVTGRWLHKPGPQGIRNFGVSFKILPTELVMISHDYGSTRTNYKFVRFFEVPDDGVPVG